MSVSFCLLFSDAVLAIHVLFCFVWRFPCLQDVMVFICSAKIRSLSEGVVPLFHNYLYVIKIYRDLCWVICSLTHLHPMVIKWTYLWAINMFKFEITLTYNANQILLSASCFLILNFVFIKCNAILFCLMGWWSWNNLRIPEAWRCGRCERRNSGSVHAVQHLCTSPFFF